MKKVLGIFVGVLLLIAMAAGLSLTSSAAPASGKALYIASQAKGTGDGSSAENAMGNSADYDALVKGFDTTAFKKNALYLAFEKLNTEGENATIVICGELVIDSANALRSSPAEMKFTSDGSKDFTITITSKYNGVDYAASNGAKLVLDKSQFQSAGNIQMVTKTVWENLNIHCKGPYESTPDKTSDWDTSANIICTGRKTIFGQGITCTTDSGKYPTIIAGKRYGSAQYNTDVTVKSGTWNNVIAGNYAIAGSDANQDLKTLPSQAPGCCTINIEGGTFDTINATGCNYVSPDGKWNRADTYIKGNLVINVSGGTITNLCGTNRKGIDGELTVNITGGSVGSVYATCKDATDKTVAPKASTVNYAKGTVTVGVFGFTTVNETAASAPGTNGGNTNNTPVQTGTALYVLMGTAAAALTGIVFGMKGKKKAVR